MQKELDIDIVPLSVIFGDESYIEGIEINNEQFYDMLNKTTKLPTTSQVNPDGFFDLFKSYTEAGHDIVGIFISKKLSGTYQSAVIAKEMINSDKIHIIDSKTATFGLSLLVYEAIKLRKAGVDAIQISNRINELKDKVKFIAVVDTLKYLRMGGRLSSSAAVLGGMLHVKPLVSVIDGEVKSVGKERGQKAAFFSILETLKKEPPDNRYMISFGHSNAPGLMKEFIDFIRSEINIEPMAIGEIGCVIGTHAGPGCVGLAYIPKQL
jgi:DegV family protein with EDD domain